MALSGVSNLMNLCRICLTSSKIMTPLSKALEDDKNTLISEALAKVMDTEVGIVIYV